MVSYLIFPRVQKRNSERLPPLRLGIPRRNRVLPLRNENSRSGIAGGPPGNQFPPLCVGGLSPCAPPPDITGHKLPLLVVTFKSFPGGGARLVNCVKLQVFPQWTRHQLSQPLFPPGGKHSAPPPPTKSPNGKGPPSWLLDFPPGCRCFF